MKKELSTRIISDLEQFEGAVVNFAPIVASYYKALIDNGVPDTLAGQLVIEWHNTFWRSNFSSAVDKK